MFSTRFDVREFSSPSIFPDEAAFTIEIAAPTIPIFIFNPGTNGGTIVLYFNKVFATNFGPAPKFIPAISIPGKLGIWGSCRGGRLTAGTPMSERLGDCILRLDDIPPKDKSVTLFTFMFGEEIDPSVRFGADNFGTEELKVADAASTVDINETAATEGCGIVGALNFGIGNISQSSPPDKNTLLLIKELN
jgi:hypothetical protein